MGQTRLYSIIWTIIFGLIATYFDSIGWIFLHWVFLILTGMSGMMLIRTFIHF